MTRLPCFGRSSVVVVSIRAPWRRLSSQIDTPGTGETATGGCAAAAATAAAVARTLVCFLLRAGGAVYVLQLERFI